MPADTASSTTYWMRGLSTTGSISFGHGLGGGKKRVPRPAAGMTALRDTREVMPVDRNEPSSPFSSRRMFSWWRAITSRHTTPTCRTSRAGQPINATTNRRGERNDQRSERRLVQDPSDEEPHRGEPDHHQRETAPSAMPPAAATPLPPLPHRWIGKQWPTTAASPHTSASSRPSTAEAEARGDHALERIADQHDCAGLESGDAVDVRGARDCPIPRRTLRGPRARRRARRSGTCRGRTRPATARTRRSRTASLEAGSGNGVNA